MVDCELNLSDMEIFLNIGNLFVFPMSDFHVRIGRYVFLSSRGVKTKLKKTFTSQRQNIDRCDITMINSVPAIYFCPLTLTFHSIFHNNLMP